MAAHETYPRRSGNSPLGIGRVSICVKFERATMKELQKLAKTAQCHVPQYVSEAVETYLVSRKEQALQRRPIEDYDNRHPAWDENGLR